jgi:hypothetical protein
LQREGSNDTLQKGETYLEAVVAGNSRRPTIYPYSVGLFQVIGEYRAFFPKNLLLICWGKATDAVNLGKDFAMLVRIVAFADHSPSFLKPK